MNIYCFSTLSFAKLQFKSVINKVFHKHGVASFTDAWIETSRKSWCWGLSASHLLQMRGLKRTRRANSSHSKLVASFTDAWIETLGSQAGLATCLSHLLQMRGLKLINPEARKKALVASFTDAWIETKARIMKARKRESHLLQMRGLKLDRMETIYILTGRIFYRCVD